MNDFLPVVFFFVAIFYASVGFGGGSSYLAILSVMLVDFDEIRSLALILNISVVTIGTIMYVRHRVFSLKAFWPFIIFSIPMAYFGAQLRLTQTVFFLILGFSLLASSFFMIMQSYQRKFMDNHLNILQKGGLGAAIGLLSGLAGIGGGIFLSPTLNMLGWANSRMIAALASFFILANSISGIAGLYVADSLRFNFSFAIPILLGVIMGGVLGSFLSNSKLNTSWIRVLTALLVGYVGLKIVLLHSLGLKI